MYLSTDAFFNNGRTTTGHCSIDNLQAFAHPPPFPPFARLRFHRTAALAEIQSVEEIEDVRPGGQNRLLFERENTLFSVLRTDEWGADLDAGGQAALHAGPPHAATRRPPHHTPQQPVGRRDRAAPLAVALVFGPTPSRCAALQNAPAEPSGAASESPPQGDAHISYAQLYRRHACQAFGSTPSRCAARRNVPAEPSGAAKSDALALRWSPKLWAFPIFH